MIMLAALAAGLLVGAALGGRPGRIAELSIRWLPLAFAGLLVQVCLFSTPLGDAAGPLGPPLYVASTAAVLAVVLRNVAIPVLAVVALGAASNLAAIVANGGYMPADPDAAASLGLAAGPYSNSVVLSDPALRPLTDIWAMPAWMPYANVFSIGDVLIALGVALTIVLAMRGRSPASLVADAGAPPMADGGAAAASPTPPGALPRAAAGPEAVSTSRDPAPRRPPGPP